MIVIWCREHVSKSTVNTKQSHSPSRLESVALPAPATNQRDYVIITISNIITHYHNHIDTCCHCHQSNDDILTIRSNDDVCMSWLSWSWQAHKTRALSDNEMNVSHNKQWCTDQHTDRQSYHDTKNRQTTETVQCYSIQTLYHGRNTGRHTHCDIHTIPTIQHSAPHWCVLTDKLIDWLSGQ